MAPAILSLTIISESDRGEVIHEQQIVAVKYSSTEIKVVVTEKSLHWLSNLCKILSKGMKITIVMGDAIEIERVFTRGYDLYN